MYKVIRQGMRYVVVDDEGEAVGRAFSSHHEAEGYRLDPMSRREQKTRTCMVCQRPFDSEGSHNRLCRQCKRQGSG